MVAWCLERLPHEQEVMDSIPGHDRPKCLNLVVVAFPFGTQDYGNSTRTGQEIVQETWICELSPLNDSNTVDTAA